MNIDDVTKSGKPISLPKNTIARRKVVQEHMGHLIAVEDHLGTHAGIATQFNGVSFSLNSDEGRYEVNYTNMKRLYAP